MSELLEALRFVKGGISKDNAIGNTHFKIKQGLVQSYNGPVSICAPIPINLDCQPQAVKMSEAIAKCDGEIVQLTITAAGKLSIKSGKFKVTVECSQEPFPEIRPDGYGVSVNGERLLSGIKTMLPFVARSGPHVWATAMLFKGRHIYATNNAVCARYDLGFDLPYSAIVPYEAIAQVGKLKEAPKAIQFGDRSATFHYEGSRWIVCSTLVAQWPDVDRFFSWDAADLKPTTEGLVEAVGKLESFVDDFSRIYFRGNFVATEEDFEHGANVEFPTHIGNSAYRINSMKDVFKVATYIDLDSVPGKFAGENIVGVIAGVN